MKRSAARASHQTTGGPPALRIPSGAASVVARRKPFGDDLTSRASLRNHVLGVVLSLLAFALLAGAVATGETAGWDAALSNTIHGCRSLSLDRLMVESTYLGSWPVILAGGVVATACLLATKRRSEALAVVASLVVNDSVISVIKTLVARSRPNQLEAILPAAGASFPSGHTFSAWALFGLLALLAWRTRLPPLVKLAPVALGSLLIVAVGFSRIYVGAHWPTDVIGSCLLGFCWLAVVDMALTLVGGRMSVQPISPRYEVGVWALGIGCWIAFVVMLAFLVPTAVRTPALA